MESVIIAILTKSPGQAVIEMLILMGGLWVLAFQSFKYIAKKWLDTKFAGKLVQLTHENNLELKKIELQLTNKLDRSTKINQKDFEILPEIWGKMVDSYYQTNELTFALRSHPDCNLMNEQQLEDLICSCQMLPSEAQLLRDATDKNAVFSDWKDWKSYINARDRHIEASIYLTKNAIILDPDLKVEIEKLQKMIMLALIEYDNKRFRKIGFGDSEASAKLHKEGKQSLDLIESAISKFIRPI